MKEGTYQAQVHHRQLADMNHILNIRTCFQETHLATPSDFTKKVPRD